MSLNHRYEEVAAFLVENGINTTNGIMIPTTTIAEELNLTNKQTGNALYKAREHNLLLDVDYMSYKHPFRTSFWSANDYCLEPVHPNVGSIFHYESENPREAYTLMKRTVTEDVPFSTDIADLNKEIETVIKFNEEVRSIPGFLENSGRFLPETVAIAKKKLGKFGVLSTGSIYRKLHNFEGLQKFPSFLTEETRERLANIDVSKIANKWVIWGDDGYSQ